MSNLSVPPVQQRRAPLTRPLVKPEREDPGRFQPSRSDLPALRVLRMLRHVHSELDVMTAIVENAMLHCSAIQVDDWIQQDHDLHRDAHHLRARVEGMAAQLEDTLRTLHRLEAQFRKVSKSRGRSPSTD